MQENKKDSLHWVHKNPAFKDFVQLFTTSEWVAMGQTSFQTYCESEDYSPEIGLAYLMAMNMAKKQLASVQSYNVNSFNMVANSVWENVKNLVQSNTTSNISAAVDWLGKDLSKKLESESFQIGSQVADLLSIENIRIALEKIDVTYCDELYWQGRTYAFEDESNEFFSIAAHCQGHSANSC